MGAIGILIVVIILGIVAGILAKNKNRSVAGWVIGTLLLTPLILVLVALKPLPPER